MRVLHGPVLTSLEGPVNGLMGSPYINSVRWILSPRSLDVVKRLPDIAAVPCRGETIRKKRILRLAPDDQEATQTAPSASVPESELPLLENVSTLSQVPTLSLGSTNSRDETYGGQEENRQDDDVLIEVISPPSPTPSETTSALLPLALLNAVTVLWGTQHAVIKTILQSDLSPGVTNFARFSVAAILFSPWTPGLFRDVPRQPFFSSAPPHDSKANMAEERQDKGEVQDASAIETWRAGAELGLWMFLGFAFQAVGLAFTTASRSAFLLYLNVKLVPLFAFVLEGRSISIATWLSAFLAFVGTVLLSSDGTPPNIGDLWSVMAAATSAMFILRLEKYSGNCDVSRLNSANLWITAGLCGLWAVWEVTSGRVDPSSAIDGVRSQGHLIAYLAVVTTALTNWMQALGQRSVPAERAAVIYALDPVYAAGFAYLLLGETLGPTGILGASIVTGAALWSQGKQI